MLISYLGLKYNCNHIELYYSKSKKTSIFKMKLFTHFNISIKGLLAFIYKIEEYTLL